MGYFLPCMFTDGGGYWQHEGWGKLAALTHRPLQFMPSTELVATLATLFLHPLPQIVGQTFRSPLTS